MKPFVSIIVPIYNVEKYIIECLDSIVNQDCSCQLECILVDDCGNDNSITLASNYLNEYSGSISFKLIHHSHNKGLSAARNTAIKESCGEYLFFIDSDDHLFHDSVTKLINVAHKYPSAEIIQGSTIPGFELSKEALPEYSDNIEWIRKALCTHEINDPVWNRLIKREFFIGNKLFFVEGYLQEDTLWSYQAQKFIKTIAFCFDTTYWYRYNPDGIMNGLGPVREAKSYARVFNYIYNDLMRYDKIEKYEIQYLVWIAKRVRNYIGKKDGDSLLVSQQNKYFKVLLRWSTNLSRLYSSKPVFDFFRKALVCVIKTTIINPSIIKLCKKDNLLMNYTPVDDSNAD